MNNKNTIKYGRVAATMNYLKTDDGKTGIAQYCITDQKLSDDSIVYDLRLYDQVAAAPDYETAEKFLNELRELCLKHCIWFETQNETYCR